MLKKVVPDHIHHRYSADMAKKSKIISMPIINANEQSYADTVKILRTIEKWISQIYKKAGLLDILPNVENPELSNLHAEAGQAGAYVVQAEDDPMRDMRIPFPGDQLTRVRFAGAKDLLSGAHSPQIDLTMQLPLSQ